MHKYLTIALVLFSLLTGCADNPESAAATDSSEIAIPSATQPGSTPTTPTDTAFPEPTATRDSPILYQSDFSSTDSGWENYREFDGILAVEEGEYRLQINQAQQTFWVVAGHNHQDPILEIDARFSDGPEENRYGVLCRYSANPLAFYAFLISVEGHAEIAIWENGALIPLQIGSFASDQESNFLRAECLGAELALHVNGAMVLEAEDTRLVAGDVGMLISNGPQSETSVFIDNFTVRGP